MASFSLCKGSDLFSNTLANTGRPESRKFVAGSSQHVGCRVLGSQRNVRLNCTGNAAASLRREQHRCSDTCHHQRRKSLIVRAAEKGSTATEVETDDNILEYCDIKKGPKRTMGEMEQDFLLALQSFYIDGAPMMSNEEFDNLKEELTWEGSSVVVLSAAEQKFMEASLAYQAGKPFLSDAEFDKLKLELKKQSSKVAIEGPRCSLRSKKVYSDASVDYARMTLLNLPAVLVALGIVFFFDDISGFEITFLLELPEPYSFIVTWFIVLPITFLISQQITNFALKDFLILTGPCPSCGKNNVSFFGTILTVENSGRVNDVKCESCGSSLQFGLDSRRITLEETKTGAPQKAPPKAVPAGAKK
eukprot:TRINITY_DN39049_c0_g1_i1.p1 TRINITY_DN39049_c0_g1~~TRINITY_DN39049_c0_g1_i1.p1  ORF type:complete len:361 (+),score=90.15 TRINITY_DN39049_c0_g1_i1:82-1164(+)